MTGGEDVVEAAFDAGINFFFVTADMHWPLYETTRRGLARLLERVRRDDVVVGVVSYVTQQEFCWAPFEEVVEAIPGLERIDVSIMGGAYAAELPARLERYREHRARSFLGIKATGCSFHDRKAALAAVNENAVDIAFVRYNAGHTRPEQDFFPALEPARKTLVYGFKSVSGHGGRAPSPRGWVPEIPDQYRFVLSKVDGVLCSLDSPAEVRALVERLALGPLDDDERRHLVELAKSRRS